MEGGRQARGRRVGRQKARQAAAAEERGTARVARQAAARGASSGGRFGHMAYGNHATRWGNPKAQL